ncbi:MAG TPA: hypothetical protein VN381_09785 [Anaerovoracaceae bacterium]|nr:hypothetical protein [Anaerovoracaceae bacterium]
MERHPAFGSEFENGMNEEGGKGGLWAERVEQAAVILAVEAEAVSAEAIHLAEDIPEGEEARSAAGGTVQAHPVEAVSGAPLEANQAGEVLSGEAASILAADRLSGITQR